MPSLRFDPTSLSVVVSPRPASTATVSGGRELYASPPHSQYCRALGSSGERDHDEDQRRGPRATGGLETTAPSPHSWRFSTASAGESSLPFLSVLAFFGLATTTTMGNPFLPGTWLRNVGGAAYHHHQRTAPEMADGLLGFKFWLKFSNTFLYCTSIYIYIYIYIY
jgi:hypothetical protein